ncbi:MAG: hypothetical protein JSR87_05775 [Proteobacteria bacterium]|nr:hypothetical protein [Pseudomonadota bacterium]MBS0573843.1 hypothetical protein [Pseudomonadota bacterium]
MTHTRLFGTLAVIGGALILLAAVLVSDQMIGRPTALIDRWFFSVGGVATMALGICARRGALTFGILAFFLVMGGASQLYVTDPQWFPALHLQPQNWKEWATVGVISAEVLVSLIVLARAGPVRFILEAAERLGLGRIALLILVTAILSVPVIGFVVRQADQAYLAHVLVALVLMPAQLLVMAAMTQVESPVSGLYRLSPLVPATVTLVVGLILTWVTFERMPHISEAMAYLFQAKTFAGGALTVPAPPAALQPGLDYPLLQVADGRWYAVTAPGWPVALAAGFALGVPWLVNPLLAALSVLLAHGVANRLAGRDQADLVAMMMGASPWLLAMSASLLPHTLELFLMLLAWWLILRAGDSTRRRTLRLVVAGLAMGWIFASRPLDGLVVGGLTGLWLLLALPGGVAAGVRRAIPYALGCLATGGLALAYNARLTGNPFLQPSLVYARSHRAGLSETTSIGNEVGMPPGWELHNLWPGHTLAEALLNTLNLAANLQFELMGWSVGSLVLVLAFFLWQKPNRTDALMLAVIFAVIAAVFFFWFPESYYIGPRFWFLAAFPLFFLSARGYQAIRERFPDQDHLAFVRIDSLFWLACVFGFCVFLPWRAVTKYYEFNDFHPTVRQDAEAGRFAAGGAGGAVVLVARNGDPASALMLNDPWLRGTIYLNQQGQVDPAAVQAALPDRTLIDYRNNWTGK